MILISTIIIPSCNLNKENKIYPQIEIIKAEEINEAWRKVVNKEARYRYVIDALTI